MKKYILLFFFYCGISSLIGQQYHTESNHCFFYENKGQIVDQHRNQNSAVRYLFTSGGLNVQIRNDGFSYDVYEKKKKYRDLPTNKPIETGVYTKKRPDYDVEYQFHRVDIDFVNANKNSEIVAQGQSTDSEHYYNLPHRPNGVENVHRFEKITYKNLYPNIDVVFFKPSDSLKPIEYNFIVHPGGKVSDIRLHFKGAPTALKDGKIEMKLRFGELQENIPSSWIENENKKNHIAVHYNNLGNGVFGFQTAQDLFDKTVIIDPVPTRVWGSYFGGDGEEYGRMKADRNNNMYLFGYTSSTNNVATAGTFQENITDGYDAFIIKMNKEGKRIWGTYYGNKYFDYTGGVDFDQNFNVYAGILSEKPNPAYPFNVNYYYPKIIFLKLNPSGNLLKAKEIGSETGDPTYGPYFDHTDINDLKLLNNKAYIIGATRVSGFGTPGSYQENFNGIFDGFLCRFDNLTADLDYFTYAGANGATDLYTIFNADSSGIEIMGATRAIDFQMINPFQATNNQNYSIGGNNGLYLKFSESGNLIKSSYLGGQQSYYFPTAQRFGNDVMFGAKMQTQKKFCYYLVDTVTNTIKDYKEVDAYNINGIIYIDTHRNIYTSGQADNDRPWITLLTTPDAYLPKIGKYSSVYYTKYDINFQRVWSTFYQGNGGTQMGMITKDYDEYLYLWGMSSRNFTGIATPNTFQQTTSATSNDMYIAKFADCQSNINVSFTPTCIGQNLQLSASGGANYEWFGPNGFYSTQQNPIISNAQAIHSGEYFVKMNGGQSCGGTFSLLITVGSPTLPILDIPTLPDITAFCSTTVTNIPTATTGCGTKIYATTTEPLTYKIPGNYVIHWKYDDGQGHILNQDQNIIIQGTPTPVVDSMQNFCKIAHPTIGDIVITGNAVKWYDDAGNLLITTTALTDGANYYVTQTISGCESPKKEITIKLNDPDQPTGNIKQDFCSAQHPTVSNLIAIGQNIIWYNAAGNILTNTAPLIDGETYFATQMINSCESSQKLAVTVSVSNGGILGNNFSDSFCNDTVSNSKVVNLNDYKTKLVTDITGLFFEFFDASNTAIPNPSSQTIGIGQNVYVVRISNNLGCYIFVKLILTLHPKPEVKLPLNNEFCNGQHVTLDAGSGFTVYEWTKEGSTKIIGTSQTLDISEVGKYWVKVKNGFGCENSGSTTISRSVLGTITGIQIVNNNATIVISSTGDYLYSLDNLNWQSTNVFFNLSNGNYTVFVKTKTGCTIGQLKFTIFDVNNSFSPNDDGINDTWTVEGIENYPNSEITVLDRNGVKVLSVLTAGSFEWNGKLNGCSLPTGIYWYIIKLSDQRILNGWLLLKNRN